MLQQASDSIVAVRPEPRRRALDNPRVLIVAVLVLAGLGGGLVWLANRTTEATPLLSDAVLYTLYGVDLAILAALFFVLGRNLVKLWVEQQGAQPFARFRAKLVAALLVMTITPSVLVLPTGSEIIRTSFTRWFSVPAQQVLDAAQGLAQQLGVRPFVAESLLQQARNAGQG